MKWREIYVSLAGIDKRTIFRKFACSHSGSAIIFGVCNTAGSILSVTKEVASPITLNSSISEGELNLGFSLLKNYLRARFRLRRRRRRRRRWAHFYPHVRSKASLASLSAIWQANCILLAILSTLAVFNIALSATAI